MAVKIACPNSECEAKYVLPDEKVGSVVSCMNCGRNFTVRMKGLEDTFDHPVTVNLPSAAFPQTGWSTIREAQDREGPNYVAAMNRCMLGYWKPVFCFLRARGHAFHDAEDLTQQFFLKLFERDWIGRADPQRGRFRNFLLTILTRFLSDQGPQRAPRQKTFDERLIPISALIGEEERSFDPAHNETPEDIFMYHWAEAVIANVRRRLELWCESCGRPDWYRVFSARHFPPADTGSPGQNDLAEQLGLSRDQVRYALKETEEQFVVLLRREVGEQVGSNDDLDAEIRDLQRLLDH